jgi:hypothetical protein
LRAANIITASELPAFGETWLDLSVVTTDKRRDAKKWLLTDCEICLRRQLPLKRNEWIFKQHLRSINSEFSRINRRTVFRITLCARLNSRTVRRKGTGK